QRSVVEHEVVRLSEFRGWTLWKISVRSNHVHVVVTATNANGSKIRDQIKANCTRALREKFTQFIDRPVWSVGGDWKCINTDEDLGQVILYASEVQDRKDRDS
ncbi:transposase, partial [Roseiconus lacunae]|uniref:transposase n=1 Tax=Roseiconus lacunae TaxID=2605694 RepID=UPI001E4A3F44|nr:transposase [Roseiconus lacunae]